MRSLWRILLLSILFCATNQNPPRTSYKERFSEALDAVLAVGLRLHALLEDPNAPNTKNFVISPISVAAAVGQLMMGAEGPFLQQLHQLLSRNTKDQFYTIQIYSKHGNLSYSLPYGRLHLQLANLLQTLERSSSGEEATLQLANGFFYDKQLTIRPDFTKKLEMYDTDLYCLNFTTEPERSRNLINEWAAKNTNNLIPMILQTDPLRYSGIVANAIYFKADWANPFADELNLKGKFNSSLVKQVDVTYMRGFLEAIPYAESARLNCKMVGIPYKNNELIMYILMPITNEYDIRSFVRNLKAREILEFIDQASTHDVVLQLPKMSLTNSISVLEPLQKYSLFKRQNQNRRRTGNDLDLIEEGVDQFGSFDPNENVDVLLSAAIENGNLKISKIVQQIVLSVNEKGTEAAAVTSGTVWYSGGSKTFRAERPFLFLIRHEATSAILFWGAVVDPSQS